MCQKISATRFRHHFLTNGAILSLCTRLNYETRIVEVGWSLFNPKDKRWIRKTGNNIARERLEKYPITFSLTQDEPVLSDYISFKALLLILGVSGNMRGRFGVDYSNNHPYTMHRDTIKAIQLEMINILSLLGQRVGLPPFFI